MSVLKIYLLRLELWLSKIPSGRFRLVELVFNIIILTFIITGISIAVNQRKKIMRNQTELIKPITEKKADSIIYKIEKYINDAKRSKIKR